MKESILRTLVPILVALLVRLGVVEWLGVDEAAISGLITVLVTGAYYIGTRLLEQWFPGAGWLIGYPAVPSYTGRHAAPTNRDNLED